MDGYASQPRHVDRRQQVHGDGGVEAHVKTMSLEAARFIQVWGGSCGL